MIGFHAEEWSRRLTVTTPEHVELRFETAGIGSRTGAQIIDLLLLLLINIGFALFGMLIVELLPEGAAAEWTEQWMVSVMIIMFTLLNFGYFLIGEYVTGGRTVGKRVMGIRVIQDNGRPISFLASAIRNLLRIVDMLPAMYFVGALFSFLHPNDKRLGDIAAGTVVVYEQGGERRKRKRIDKMLLKWRPMLPDFTLEAWERERINGDEWALLSGFAERLPYMTEQRAEKIAQGIIELLAPKLGLMEPWVEALEAAKLPPQTSSLPRRGDPKKKPISITWTLRIYELARPDWEWQASIGSTAESP